MPLELLPFLQKLQNRRDTFAHEVPSPRTAAQWVEQLFDLLFPVREKPVTTAVESATHLQAELAKLLGHAHPQEATAIAHHFFLQLPAIYDLLWEDAEAFYKSDPAASSVEEVLATYPGFFAIAVYRIAHVLHQLDIPLLPRILSEYAHSKTGIDIHPAARIGRSFFIDHGTGVVIGATSDIGDQVKIYQGVTLGALQVDKGLAGAKRHPTIGDHVVIYANATILGGKTVIGRESIIGGNTWITESVAPQSVVLHQPQVKVKSKFYNEPLLYVI